MTLMLKNATCDEANGEIAFIVSGGQPPYQYSVDNGSTSQGDNVFTDLAEGTYAVIITDANGCAAVANVEVEATGAASATILPDSDPSDLCYGETVFLNAGAFFETYIWSTGETTSIIETTTAGTYSVTVTDANNCTATDEIEVNVDPPIELNAVEIEVVELGESTTIGVMFPNPALTYEWTGPDGFTYTGTSFEFDGIAQGDYTYVVATTVDGCTVTDTVSFEVLDSSNWGVPNAFSPNGDGVNDTFGPAVGGTLTIIEFRFSIVGVKKYMMILLGIGMVDSVVRSKVRRLSFT